MCLFLLTTNSSLIVIQRASQQEEDVWINANRSEKFIKGRAAVDINSKKLLLSSI